MQSKPQRKERREDKRIGQKRREENQIPLYRVSPNQQLPFKMKLRDMAFDLPGGHPLPFTTASSCFHTCSTIAG